MAKSTAGFVLSLIGGIFGIFSALLIFGAIIVVARLEFGATLGVWIWVLSILAGFWTLVTAILTIVGGVWMRKAETVKKGSIMVLICSLIGGILGLVESSK